MDAVEPRTHIVFAARASLECGDAVLDTFVVDACDRRRILCSCRPYHHAGTATFRRPRPCHVPAADSPHRAHSTAARRETAAGPPSCPETYRNGREWPPWA